jgi:hypothetical protein
MRRGVWILFGTSLLIIMITGCWNPFSSDDGGGGQPPPPEYDRTRDGILNFFANAYETKDLDKYGIALHDKFQFQFTPDVAESIGLPADEPWWGRTEDIASTENMFGAPTVTHIQMDLPVPAWFLCQVIRRNPLPDPPDTLQGFCTRVTPDIRVIIEEPGKEELILKVDTSWLDIAITPDPNDDELWQIIAIVESEQPSGG